MQTALCTLFARYPCCVCGGVCDGLICDFCVSRFIQQRVDAFPKDRCSSCGQPLVSCHDTCLCCREKTEVMSFDSVYPLFSYKGWGRRFMTEWKVRGNRTCAFTAALYMSKSLTAIAPYSVIVPVPPRQGKLLRVGWDQIRDLTEILRYYYGFSVATCLARGKSSVQKKLNRAERLVNLSKSIRVIDTVPQDVILIDDVLTTGATLEACAAALKRAGARSVTCCTLFYD